MFSQNKRKALTDDKIKIQNNTMAMPVWFLVTMVMHGFKPVITGSHKGIGQV